MNLIKWIWPTFGNGHIGQPRNLSWTKKGPGRRHSNLPKRVVEAIARARANGAVIDPTNIEFKAG